MAGSSTIATSETKIEALKLQSSAYGLPIPVLGGVNRIPGNLIDYVDFKATAHTTTQSRGGKGGGVKTQNTTYTYSASVVMGICQGQIGAISRVWKGKEVLTGGWSPAAIAAATETYTVPGSGPMAYTLAHAATALGAPSISYTQDHEYTNEGGSVVGYSQVVRLASGRDFSFADGVVTILKAAYRGQALTIQYQWGSGAPDLSPLVELGITLVKGDLVQPAASWLVSDHPARAFTYPGLAYVHAEDYDLGSGASVDNHSFEVQGAGAYRYGPTLPDCNPAEFSADLLTNDRYGARLPADTLDVEDWVTYCAATGLLMSPLLKEQQRAGDYVEQICRMTNSAPVWSYDRLRIVPLGDVATTGNGATYTPNTTPLYDLDDDSWLQDGTEDPLQWENKQPSDRYNHVRVEFNDRGNYYNTTIAEAKDDADISVNGLRTMATVSAPWICDAAVAALVARILMQRSLNITGTGRIKLPWSYCLLEPADLVTLTDEALGFAKLPVRITAIGDDEDGTLEVEVEDWPLGTASPARYPSQVAAGFQHNYNASPGSVDVPVFFEAPVERTTTGLEVYAAVKGSGPFWGGCGVWISLDGSNYKRMATVYGGARYGSLTGPISAGNLPVAVSGQLLSGSAADAAGLSTLCWVGGAVQEYLAYETATLGGSAGVYTLSGLVRGGYGTSTASAHANGAPFVRVDDAIAKSGPLDLALIGKTISLKFTSFNIFQAGEQSLADVSAYTYAITGAMVALPPSAVTGLAVSAEPFGLRIRVNKNPEPDVVGYEYRQGGSWAGGTVLEAQGGTSYLWRVQAVGAYTVWVAAIDALGNRSAPASVAATVTAPAASGLAAAFANDSLLLSWGVTPGSFDLREFIVRHGASFAAGSTVATQRTSTYVEPMRWTGSRTYWVAAVDAAGNIGAAVSVVATPSLAAAPTVSALISGPNLVLSWGAVAGALSTAAYEVRHGASWAAGTLVQQSAALGYVERVAWSGAGSYWVAALDAAGAYGAVQRVDVSITAPGAVTAGRAEVVDNNALLYWGAPATGSLPVDRYEVRKGSTWAGGTLVGSNGNSTFTAIFEQSAGSYTYWVAAIDSAGTAGAPSAIPATISQPPDYVLRADYNDDWAGITLSGLYLEDGKLYGPALGETIQAHFEGRGWATPDDQITAGYPLVFQPSGTSGYCERTMDYGTALPATIITVTPSVAVLSGSVTLTVQLSYKALAGDAWIDAPVDARQVLASAFRYVKVRLTFTASGGDDLVEVQGLNIKLSGKLKTDSGAGSAVSADSGGTVVLFTAGFIDVQAIVVTPAGTAARYAIYDFADVPNPTSFKVLLFDSAGNRVSGDFSWTARGY